MYEFKKRWSVRRKPSYSLAGIYESKEVKYSVNLEEKFEIQSNMFINIDDKINSKQSPKFNNIISNKVI